MKLTNALNQKGFSLIELSIFIMISGLVMASLFQGYGIYLQRQAQETTQGNLNLVDANLNEFYGEHQKYPCPASPTATDEELGFDSNDERCAALYAVPVGECLADICVVAGLDVGGGALDSPDGTPERVLIGSVPADEGRELATCTIDPLLCLKYSQDGLEISDKEIIDAWGGQLVYAVTERLTRTADFNVEKGAITVVDEFGNDVIVNEDPTQERGANYIVVSLGENGKGAYNMNGVMLDDCAVTVISEEEEGEEEEEGGVGSLYTTDVENCDRDDAVFLSGLVTKNPGPQENDDSALFSLSRKTALWDYVNGTDDIYNLNPGNVGINTETPEEALHVEGVMRSNDLYAARLCNEDGDACFQPSVIGGAGITCSGGEVLRGVWEAAPQCTSVAFSGTVNPGACDDDEYVTGFTSSGDIICGTF